MPQFEMRLPPCQICGRPGHSAINCYHRMDHAYEGKIPTKQLAAMVATQTPTSNEQTWYTDSGASTHITPNLANLSIHNDYDGKDQVTVGNGAGLKISHIGSSQVHNNSSNFHLSNILHCPSVSTNLLSVHQFSRDNHCFFVFDSDIFFVVDKMIGKILFRGQSENGLYPFHLRQLRNKASTHFSLIGVHVSHPIWRHRLGHPAHPILQRIVSKHQLPLQGKFECNFFCDSCPLGKSSRLPFQASNSISTTPLELVHSDIWTSPHFSIKGSKYYLLFVDDYFKYSWI